MLRTWSVCHINHINQRRQKCYLYSLIRYDNHYSKFSFPLWIFNLCFLQKNGTFFNSCEFWWAMLSLFTSKKCGYTTFLKKIGHRISQMSYYISDDSVMGRLEDSSHSWITLKLWAWKNWEFEKTANFEDERAAWNEKAMMDRRYWCKNVQ